MEILHKKKNLYKAPGKLKEEETNKHPHGIYKGAPYHHPNSKGSKASGKSPAPSDGQAALDNSVKIKNTAPHRIGVSNGEIVKLNESQKGEYHGYVLSWEEASQIKAIKDALIDNGFVNKKGKIL